jgi:vitamin B12 transporter
MQLNHPAGLRAALTLVPCLVTGIASLCSAEIESELAPTVVSATRMVTPLPHVGSSISTLDAAELEARGIYDLQTALNELPGVTATSTAGQRGASGSLFIRGTPTSYSQLIVDGVRLSDSTVALGNFLGSSALFGFDRIEVLRGPQSALYGGEAIGGVISMESQRGTGDPTRRLDTEVGSFASFQSSASFSGQLKDLGYFLGTRYEETENDAPNNAFSQSAYVLRLDEQLNPAVSIGLTARGSSSDFEDRGYSTEAVDYSLVTLFADLRLTPVWTSHLIAGLYQEDYHSASAIYGDFGTELERLSLSADNQLDLGDGHRLAFGGFFERADYANTIGTAEARDRFGVHAGWEWQLSEALTTYLAGRWEDYAAYGNETTYRGTLAYQVPRSDTLLRASYGRAFRTPTYSDLFGSSYGVGNPNLSAETSHGWDFGVQQTLTGSHVATLTWFENSIAQRIDSYATPPANLSGTSKSNGLEAAVDGTLPDPRWSYRASYTFLQHSLSDQPPQTANLSLDFHPSTALVLGLGACYVDARSYGGAPLDDYFLMRLHASYEVTSHVRLHARIENLLNEDYLLSDFSAYQAPITPGRGTAIFTGVTIEW